jgi:hypothetical protein
LVGTDPERLEPVLDRLFAGEWQTDGIPPLWDGHTVERIVAASEQLLRKSRATETAPTHHCQADALIPAKMLETFKK